MKQVVVFCRSNFDCDNLEKFLHARRALEGRGARFSCTVLAGQRGEAERK
jgi:ATP-dependent RNA helicase DDX1